MVIKIDSLWYLFYCATQPSEEGNHVVAYRTSSDLLKWSEKHIAFTDPRKGTTAGPTESPFVVHENGWWYLLIGPRSGYSQTPTNFSISQQIGEINSHAAEVIFDGKEYWISHCGWSQRGVYLAPLYFE